MPAHTLVTGAVSGKAAFPDAYNESFTPVLLVEVEKKSRVLKKTRFR
ncbi:MAG: hypothetical protein JRJ69_08280 [Deltaproteobacteria bacterium]|nr:hypothetical protein [Deltaproteobacteria bacterium]MBW1737534.1 hypothetical protein [Deltaproteobacteria bacterium]MBW1910906.1 hypothetical protein [Deltaproteobacteria bacterium]MBW2033799.1 hypothetical protein [Deltaproteobacteria bacterium]MBW2115502.1 hypothetical protein [Deltaproteobacteria bacterium]